ncbi:hypothetical protein AA0229_1224 [Gluconobacter cerinus NRIC 0229]|nr:hypothetical protein AA0229_1224 [Gluconobacter cerinus NRIC 0229]
MDDPREGFHPILVVQVTYATFEKPTFAHKTTKNQPIDPV